MAYSPEDRVRVTAQSSDYRGKLGTVETVDGDGNHVRIDGFAVGSTVLLRDNELATTNFASEVDYGD